jgi:hypothetical protein
MALASVVAISALMMAPFGQLSELIHDGQPFFGFDPENAVLTLVRIQKVSIPKCVPDKPCACQAWSSALSDIPGETFIPLSVVQAVPSPVSSPVSSGLPAENLGHALNEAWKPWNQEDLKGIQECDHSPCDVKLNAAEGAEMKKKKQDSRLAEYLDLVGARVERYEKTQERKEYEYPGDPVDPWKLLEQRGLKPSLERPPAPLLFTRILDFGPGKIQKMHQIVDRRALTSKDGNEAVVWLRDVYTDHYFDSWGEYSQVICEPEQGDMYVVLALIGEMDLLKNTGFIAGIARPRERAAFRDNGKIYLNHEFGRLRAGASSGR